MGREPQPSVYTQAYFKQIGFGLNGKQALLWVSAFAVIVGAFPTEHVPPKQGPFGCTELQR